jgi:hypothetical protein
MGSVKGKCINNNGEKELLKVSIHEQKRGTFLGKEVLQKMCKKSRQNKMQKGDGILSKMICQ